MHLGNLAPEPMLLRGCKLVEGQEIYNSESVIAGRAAVDGPDEAVPLNLIHRHRWQAGFGLQAIVADPHCKPLCLTVSGVLEKGLCKGPGVRKKMGQLGSYRAGVQTEEKVQVDGTGELRRIQPQGSLRTQCGAWVLSQERWGTMGRF